MSALTNLLNNNGGPNLKKYRDYRTAIARTLTMIQPTDEGLAKGAKAIQEILNLALDPDTIVDSDNTRIARLATSNAHNETSGHATQANAEDSSSSVKTTSTQSNGQTIMQVKRDLKGFDLVDPNDPTITPRYHYDEILARQLVIHHDDQVLLEQNLRQHRQPYIDKIVSHATTADPITVAAFFVVHYQDTDDTYHIEQDYNGTTLSSLNPTMNDVTFTSQEAQYQRISNGQLVDLAWYKERPEKVVIRYVHHSSSQPTSNKAAKPAKKATIHTTTVPVTLRTLDFDLHEKTVAIVMGDVGTRRTQITQLIDEHNGHTLLIDAFKHSNSTNFYYRQIGQADLVVMIQNQNKHATSKTLNKAVKHYGIKMTIADGGGLQQIERAVYRGIADLPAYESGNPISYPRINDASQ